MDAFLISKNKKNELKIINIDESQLEFVDINKNLIHFEKFTYSLIINSGRIKNSLNIVLGSEQLEILREWLNFHSKEA